MKNQKSSFFLKYLKDILLFCGAALLYCLLFLVIFNVIKFEQVFNKPTWEIELLNFIYNYALILVLAILNYVVIFKLRISSKRIEHLWLKILSDLILSFLFLFIFEYVVLFFLEIIFDVKAFIEWTGAVVNNFLIYSIVETLYYIVSSQKSLKQVEYERRKVMHYHYMALKSQINPHFLFNSLNILYALVPIDTQKSQNFIMALSNMYRYILDHQDKKSILLSEELEFLKSYTNILKMRYQDQLDVSIEVECSNFSKNIIPFTLQLLVENVTKHNIISSKHPMTIRITLYKDFLTVYNPIKNKTSEEGKGIGLNYISEQYNIFNKNFKIENDGINFTATVPYL